MVFRFARRWAQPPAGASPLPATRRLASARMQCFDRLRRRLALVRTALAHGICTQITVSPYLPSSLAFAETLAQAVGDQGRVIVDTFLDGDGSGGQRSARLGMDAVLAEAGFPGWFTRCREHAQELMRRLLPLLGPERVLWSAGGFSAKPKTIWQE